MSLATKIAAGLCICPVVAAPPAMLHKPTRDKVARAAGYVPKAAGGRASPIAISPQVSCIDPTPSAPLVPMGQLATPGNNLPQLPMTVPGGGGGGPFFPGGPGNPGTPVGPTIPPTEIIPGVPEPATWTIMVVGFGLVGAALRRNRTANGQRRETDKAEA